MSSIKGKASEFNRILFYNQSLSLHYTSVRRIRSLTVMTFVLYPIMEFHPLSKLLGVIFPL